MDIINRIVITISLELHDYLDGNQENNIHDLATEFMTLMMTPKNLAKTAIILGMNDFKDKNALSPSDVNAIVANYLKQTSQIHVKKSTVSKTVANLEKDKIFERIKGKKNIQKEIGDTVLRGRGKSTKKSGYQIIYKTTIKVKDYTRILNNSEALDLINQRLLTSYENLLCQFYQIALNDIFDIIIKHGNPLIYRFFSMSSASIDPTNVISENNWERFRDELSKLSDEERQKYIDEATISFTRSPQILLFLVLSLAQKKYRQN